MATRLRGKRSAPSAANAKPSDAAAPATAPVASTLDSHPTAPWPIDCGFDEASPQSWSEVMFVEEVHYVIAEEIYALETMDPEPWAGRLDLSARSVSILRSVAAVSLGLRLWMPLSLRSI